MSVCFLALGSNVGKRKTNIKKAIRLIESNLNIDILKSASVYESEPIGPPGQSKYLNTVIKIKTTLKPLDLLNEIKDIESKMGRRKTIRWGPRIIDIDILFYQDRIINSKKLTIPHPELHKRIFVLKPFNEMEPGFLHPVLKRRIKDLLQDIE